MRIGHDRETFFAVGIRGARIRDIAERMYPAYGSVDSREAFLDRILDTVLFFESKYWLVGVPY